MLEEVGAGGFGEAIGHFFCTQAWLRQAAATADRTLVPIGPDVIEWPESRSDQAAAPMKVSVSIDCSPTEMRRLIGQPDLFPIYQTVALAIEDWLVRLIAERTAPLCEAEQDLRSDRPRRAVRR